MRTPNGPLSPPIYQTAAFTFDSLEMVDGVWEGERPGYAYSRMGNPNHTQIEDSFALWHGAEAAVCAASGMAVLFAALVALTDPGDGIILPRDLYGGTMNLARTELRRMDRRILIADGPAPEAIEKAWDDGVRLLLVESISNPLVRPADIPRLAELCREHGMQLAVDNTMASPVLARPLDSGAAVVMESATKYLCGNSALIGGMLAGSQSTVDRCREFLVNTGATLDPFAAWLMIHGMFTLGLRVRAATHNAFSLARFLQECPGVKRVHYPGLPSDPDHDLAARVLPGGAGAVLSFVLSGGRSAVNEMMDRLELVSFAPTLGDVRTIITHPATTSHRSLEPAELAAAGIEEGMVRVSVGIEDCRDIEGDFAVAIRGSG